MQCGVWPLRRPATYRVGPSPKLVYLNTVGQARILAPVPAG
jgi:hypothetical protein